MENSNNIDENRCPKKEALNKADIYLEDVRQGIIWSQILEIPRSKNPYFLSKRI